MRKNIILTILCVISIILVSAANYYEQPVWGWGWTRILFIAPIMYAIVNFRRSVAVFIAMMIIVSQEPILIVKFSRNPVFDVTHMVAVIAISFLTIIFGHILKKERENSRYVEYIHNLIRSTRGILDEDRSLSILENAFSTWCKTEEITTYLFGEDGGLRPRTNPSADPLPPKHLFYAVAKSREYMVSFNPFQDDRISLIGCDDETSPLSQLAVFAIEYGGIVRGVICAANSQVEPFSKGLVDILSAIKQTVETTLGLAEKLRQRIDHEMQITKIRNTLSSYLPPAVAEEALKHPYRIEIGGEIREATVMFTEVSNFKKLMKTEPTEKLLSMLNEFFSVAMDAIFESEGTVDKFIEDNIMAYWGAPLAVEDAERKSLSCALRIQKSTSALNEKWKAENKPQFTVSIGINAGKVVAGNIGSEKRMEYTVIGDAVNIAARIKSLCGAKDASILAGESVYEKANKRFDYEHSFQTSIRGITNDIVVYQLKKAGSATEG